MLEFEFWGYFWLGTAWLVQFVVFPVSAIMAAKKAVNANKQGIIGNFVEFGKP